VVLQAPRAQALNASVTGFVVAGGRSARMGRDKSLLPWKGTTLLDRAIALLRVVTDDVRILCGPKPRYADRGLPIVVDVPGPPSPLVGLLSALAADARETSLLLAVDLPHATAALLQGLVDASSGADAVVPISPSGPEPLCAVYQRACREPIRESIARGDLKMTGFWSYVRVLRIEGETLARLGDPNALFVNVNAPADYDRAIGIGQ
jgi:molybdopterin-guanine dinucleotide biosynthesis protein A